MNKFPVKNMFDNIAGYYDVMNNIISLGTDKIIKKKSIKLLGISNKAIILDLCTGTGDLAKIIQALHLNVKITAVDFSKNMLDIAQKKVTDVEFIEADATNLPLQDNYFDFITISYGLRNIADKEKAILEMYRVLKAGGKILHLDFGKKNLPGKIFEFFVPYLAKLLGKDYGSYRYLVQSKRSFFEPKELIKKFEKNNFRLIKRKDFMFKSISAQVYQKI